MEITIFQDVTTESALRQLEADGEKYQGLYVDMDNREERKYIKESASMIAGLLKTLDRARIDKARDYKNSVEREAESIRLRLEEANRPFSLLIDEHKAKRAAILAEQKAREEAAALVIQIELDHEAALIENNSRAFDKIKLAEIQARRDAEIAAEAVRQAGIDAELAVVRERERVERAAQAERDEQARRERDVEHKRQVNVTAVEALTRAGISEEQAKMAVKLIARGLVPNVTIKY